MIRNGLEHIDGALVLTIHFNLEVGSRLNSSLHSTDADETVTWYLDPDAVARLEQAECVRIP